MKWRDDQRLKDKAIRPIPFDDVWAIEKPERALNEQMRDKQLMQMIKYDLDSQMESDKRRHSDKALNDLAGWRAQVDDDNNRRDHEKDVINFKKQAFKKDLRAAWDTQVEMKRTMKDIESLY